MPRPVLRRRAAAAALCVLTTTAACSGGSSGTTSSTTTTGATTSTTAGLPAGATAVPMRGMQVGQCFDRPKDDPEAIDRAVWVMPCSDPHTHEVNDLVAYAGPTAKGAYPGTPVVQDWAEQTCFSRFEPFVGRSWTTSSFEIQTWWPSQDSWGKGDRTVICSVFPSDGGHTTGSARGANR